MSKKTQKNKSFLKTREFQKILLPFFILLGIVVAIFFVSRLSAQKSSVKPMPLKSIPTITSTPTPTAVPTLAPTRIVLPSITSTPTSSPTPSVSPTTGPMGFNFTTTRVTTDIGRGECKVVLSFTSTGSTSWLFNPITFLGSDVYWEKSSGTASKGETIDQKICLKADASTQTGPGMNAGGTSTFYDKTTNATHDIIVNLKFK